MAAGKGKGMAQQMSVFSAEHGHDDVVKEDSCVSDAFRFLLRNRGITVKKVADDTGISENTLYGIKGRNYNRANMHLLKRLADYFGEDISIFCGMDEYEKPQRLQGQEQEILDFFRKMNTVARKRAYDMLSDMSSIPANQNH